jgi:hypothetical protein
MNSALVFVNEAERRIGETHPRAKLTDEEVGLIRDLIEALVAEAKTKRAAYTLAAEKFETSRHNVCSIDLCRRRAQTTAGTKRIAVDADPAPVVADQRTVGQRLRDWDDEYRRKRETRESTGRPLTREELERIVRGEQLPN